MSDVPHIDELLKEWPYEADSLNVRMAKGADGREIIQMRIDLGLLQLEITGRPDGTQPHGTETYQDHLLEESLQNHADWMLSESQCGEVDREFVQYYHRRMCWLKLRQYHNAVRDADHTLGLMDFCNRYSPDERWTQSHEQYRPFVMFHRVHATALAALEDDGAEVAVQEINTGLRQLKQEIFDDVDQEEFEEDELVQRLIELRETLRQQYEVGRTLEERLDDAIASEQYELAAELRDALAQREAKVL